MSPRVRLMVHTAIYPLPIESVLECSEFPQCYSASGYIQPVLNAPRSPSSSSMDPSNVRQKFDRFQTFIAGRGSSHELALSAPSPSSVEPSVLRRKFSRFRILIIGRANAGKTTILQRVCDTRENPKIYNSAGKKIKPAVLKASRKCGEHDIENEMVFQSNPGFVFHDSRGFEAGGDSKFDKVKAFITDRSKRTSVND
ncbi:uncharacterized protein EDB91DRAFT_1348250 [Suillus paluster]|uniref:uncharacterized protein n=1 Tax=Suillus paluster TaxID=48578 RepID=UPI001B870DF8|nr:uncharacterized protein EDB91DRAFT_1348250 [Suillus paluster]KAG1735754.1 hypothetical protein EDB91DRAFT_1348250 [Suillus paluster]